MKNANKIILIIGAVFVSVMILFVVCIDFRSDHIDFSGEVISIENTEDYLVFTVRDDDANEVRVLTDVHTTVMYCHVEDGDIYSGDIEVGDSVQGRYKLFSEDGYAELFVVSYNHE